MDLAPLSLTPLTRRSLCLSLISKCLSLNTCLAQPCQQNPVECFESKRLLQRLLIVTRQLQDKAECRDVAEQT